MLPSVVTAQTFPSFFFKGAEMRAEKSLIMTVDIMTQIINPQFQWRGAVVNVVAGCC